MTSRQSLALKIGGRGLLKAILRSNASRYVPQGDVIDFKPIDLNDFASAQAQYAQQPMPEVLTKDVRALTSGDKLWIRNRYYALVNSPPSALRRWYRDPRTVDCTFKHSPFEMLIVNRQIRDLITLQSSGHKNGSGWIARSYATAQKSIFVIQHLYRLHGIKYFAWVLLQTFGHDWSRSIKTMPLRPLPPATMLEAAKRLQQLKHTKKPGEGLSQ